MIIEWMVSNLLWTEGFYILIACLILIGIFWKRSRIGLFMSFLIFGFCFWFFRNPDRICVEAIHDTRVLISPSDGTVVDVQKDFKDSDSYFSQKISVFLSPLNVHVNWIPVNGIIEYVAYHKGKFLPAFLPKSSELNERNDIMILAPNGYRVKVRQIAGTVAYQIVCWVKKEQLVKGGEKFGMIRFGSRVEIFLPKHADIAVQVGEHIKGGETVLGRWNR